MITHERLLEVLSLDFTTGAFTWKTRGFAKFDNKHAGKPAGCRAEKSGNRCVRVDGVLYIEHRLMWFYQHGVWPTHGIDHESGDWSENGEHNLRDVPQAVNTKNQRMRSTNTSGVMGVCFDGKRGKWYAQIKVDYKNKHLGRFDSFDEAVAARKAAELAYGFHPNHGRS